MWPFTAQTAVAQNTSKMAFLPSSSMLIREMESNNHLYALQTRGFLYPDLYDNKYFNIDLYQALYSRTPQYDPIGDDTKEALYKYAYTYDTAGSDAEKAQALADFRTLLEAHLGNFDTVTAAIALVQGTPDLFDLEALKRMRALMIQRLMASGTGNTATNAYVVYTATEETFILVQRNAELIETEPLTAGMRAYHIHRIVDRVTGQAGKIYVNVSAARKKQYRDDMLERTLIREQKPDPVFEISPLD